MSVVPASRKGKNPTEAKPVSRLPLDPALVREWRHGPVAGPTMPCCSISRHMFARAAAGVPKASVHGAEGIGASQRGRPASPASGGCTIAARRIVRLILGHVPIGAIADKLDTSAKMIEATYARWIGSTTDNLFRAALPKRKKLAAVA